LQQKSGAKKTDPARSRNLAQFEVGDTGSETTPKPSGKTSVSPTGGAENGALDPNLTIVISAWPLLSKQSRLIIVGLARKVAKQTSG
jgi:hypothetical protein